MKRRQYIREAVFISICHTTARLLNMSTDERDSTIQTKLTITTTTTAITDVEEEPVKETRLLDSEAATLPAQRRAVLAEALYRCLPARNTPLSRVLVTVVVIFILVVTEVVLTGQNIALRDALFALFTSQQNETTSGTPEKVD
jgi:hypothetical protein